MLAKACRPITLLPITLPIVLSIGLPIELPIAYYILAPIVSFVHSATVSFRHLVIPNTRAAAEGGTGHAALHGGLRFRESLRVVLLRVVLPRRPIGRNKPIGNRQ